MKKILVIEDSKAEQLLIEGLLKGMGLDVTITNNGQDALGWLQQHGQPDLIVTDIVMPGISGLDLCRKIRTELQFTSVPIVFCSSKDQDFDQFWALRQGGNAYLTKPYSPTDLMKVIKQYV